MAISVSCYGQRIETPSKYLNRIELWRYNGNTTGDGSGGNIDFNLYFPQSFDAKELSRLCPFGAAWYLEQISLGSDIAASASLSILTGSALEDYITTGVSGSGQILGIYMSAGTPTPYITWNSYYKFPFYLGRRRVWDISNPVIVLRIANVNAKKYDNTTYLSLWNGIPEDLFKHI